MTRDYFLEEYPVFDAEQFDLTVSVQSDEDRSTTGGWLWLALRKVSIWPRDVHVIW